MNVFVIGGGASGLVSAIEAKKRGLDVTILERNSFCGKKILMTGNGKCNFWNHDQNINHYHSQSLSSISDLIKQVKEEEVLSFFESIGIVTKEKNGYLYPYSNQASSIRDALVIEAKLRGVKVITDVLVTDISKQGEKFVIISSNGVYHADAIILATGSMSYPKTGSDGMGYSFATSLGHSCIPILPSLVQLIGTEKDYSIWNGVRTDVILSLYENDKLLAIEQGEIQLTDYGISGIVTFNLSGFVSKGLHNDLKEEIRINFVPWFKEDFSKFLEWLDNRANSLKGRNVRKLLSGFLNDKLVLYFLKKLKINEEEDYLNLANSVKEKLVSYLLNYSFLVSGTKSFDQAQVCSGGIPLTEVCLETMESSKVSNLYFTGEILDIDGDCGGYNLGFAWISGIIAGRSVLK